jgi:hypothetical protein
MGSRRYAVLLDVDRIFPTQDEPLLGKERISSGGLLNGIALARSGLLKTE